MNHESKGVPPRGLSSRDRTHCVVQHRSIVIGVEAMSLRTDRVFPRHAHDQLGIGVMTRGAQRSWSGLGSVEAEAGDIITVNPGEMHDGLPVLGRARAWRMLYIDPARVARTAGLEVGCPTEMARPSFRDPVLAGRFARAFARLTDRVPDDLAAEQDVLRLLVHALGQHGAGRGPRRSVAVPGVDRARRRLDDAPQVPIALAELAALEGISRFQLIRGFVRATGATPHAYLVQRRVRLARHHMINGLEVAEAALEAGFADQSHMTRAFVRQFGITPARYRAALP